MRVRLFIDRIVVDRALSPAERAALADDLRESLTSTLTACAGGGQEPPVPRQAPRERLSLDGSTHRRFGAALGDALGAHIWSGPATPRETA